MDNLIINKYKNIINSVDSISNNSQNDSNIFFKSFDDYNLINSLHLDTDIKDHILNKKIECGLVINIHKIYSIEDFTNQKTIQYNNNNNNELQEFDLISISDNYYFVITVESNSSIIVQPIIEESKINKDDILYKILNCKKYNTLYNILHNLNKKCLLRNLLIPSSNPTKLINNKLNSDFWNEEQKNTICNINKATENKKIHVINGKSKTGKSTVLLGLLANMINKDINNKHTIISPTKINNLLDKLISQQHILFQNQPLIMLIGDIQIYNEKYHHLHISKYINTYKQIIPEIIKELNSNEIISQMNIDNILIKLVQLIIEPHSYKNEPVSELFININDDKSYKDYIISILSKWTNDKYISNILFKNCTILLSPTQNNIDISEYNTNILIVDDAEQVSEINIIEHMKVSTQQLILLGNNEQTNEQTLFNRMITGGINPHNLITIY